MKNLILLMALTLGVVFIGDVNAAEEPVQLTKKQRAAKAEKKRVEKLASEGIPFREEFTWLSIENLIDDIKAVSKLKKKGEYINLLLDSGGGSVFAGSNLIHNIMKIQNKGILFRGVVENVCFSMCFVTLQALNERISYPFAMIMDHRPSGGTAHVLQEIVEAFDPLIESRLLVDKELYKMAVYSEVWLSAPKAIRWGLLDRVVFPGKSFELPAKKVIKEEVK